MPPGDTLHNLPKTWWSGYSTQMGDQCSWCVGAWEQMATGVGHACLEEVMAVFGVPVVIKKRALCQLSLHLTRSGGVHLMNQ